MARRLVCYWVEKIRLSRKRTAKQAHTLLVHAVKHLSPNGKVNATIILEMDTVR